MTDLINNIRNSTETTNQWFLNRPLHVQRAYKQNWPACTETSKVPFPSEFANATQFERPQFVNILAMVDLLRKIDYTDVDQFFDNCIELIGPLPPGTGWKQRSDSKYSNPMDQATFQEANNQYIQDGLTTRRAGEHTSGMLAEILQEVDMGRIEGPFRAPAHWCRQTVPVKHNRTYLYLTAQLTFLLRPTCSPLFKWAPMATTRSDAVKTGGDPSITAQ